MQRDRSNANANIGHQKLNLTQTNITRSKQLKTSSNRQLSSFVLFISVVILINLCPPFDSDFDSNRELNLSASSSSSSVDWQICSYDNTKLSASELAHQVGRHLANSLEFIRLMFTSPIRLGSRNVRVILAEAKVIGKMAKVWFIKKKIKKLSKKLKKHTIAVPVFTAIPIYEHSYYPQPQVTHVTHAGMHHAASSYSPSALSAGSASGTASQQLAASASNTHHQLAAYRLGQHHHGHHYHMPSAYHPSAAASHQIINSYAPAPPTYVDDSAGLYGHYGNAYGRYDGGYQYW